MAQKEEHEAAQQHEQEQEQEKIDVAKYKLQELEEQVCMSNQVNQQPEFPQVFRLCDFWGVLFFQGRINALVEAEVKKRLVEERVQREKQRRMEKEKERLRHDKQLTKIRHTHRREMKRLRQKYESTG